MTGWRQAVFVRQRRGDVIQRALSKILDEESWSPATPRRLYVGASDASPRGWTMIVPELANFFLDRGGMPARRLCRLARALRCPAYEVDVRDGAEIARAEIALYEADEHGQLRISGAAAHVLALDEGDAAGDEVTSPIVGFGLVAVPGEARDRIAALAELAGRRGPAAAALADCLGAVAGFPDWTRRAQAQIAAGELIYEPPRILARGTAAARVTAPAATVPLPGTRAAIGRAAPRGVPAAYDRRGRRPRSAVRPRR